MLRNSLVLALPLAILSIARASAAPGSGVLVLGVKIDSGVDAEARDGIVKRLQKITDHVKAPRLSTSELICSEEPCLKRLAEKEHASHILRGEIWASNKTYSYKLWIWNVQAGELPREKSGKCDDCERTQLAEEIGKTAGLLFEEMDRPPVQPAESGTPGGYPQQPVTPPLVEPPARVAPTETPAPPVALTPQSSRWAFGRGIAIGVFSGLAAVGLGASIALTYYDGQKLDTDMSKMWDLSWRPAAAWSSTAAAGLGLVMTLVWPTRKAQPADRSVQSRPPTGLAFGFGK